MRRTAPGGRRREDAARKPSSSAPGRCGRAGRTCAANLGLGDLLDFRKNEGGFILKGRFHGFVVAFGILSGAMFEFQVAQVVVNSVTSLEKLIEFCPVWSEVRGVGLNIENE